VDKRLKIALIIGLAAIAGYVAIRWYEGRKAAQDGSTGSGTGLGSNLNSLAPELIGGSTGPSIGPALSTPITINVTSSGPPEEGANPVGNMVSSATVTPSPLALANPENSATGAQASAPQPEDMRGAGIDSAATGPTAMTPMAAGVTRPNSVSRETGRPPAAKVPDARKPEPAKPVRRPGVKKEKV
jgi:hypothetical protein